MSKILWLASWYPNRLDPLNGDFIERHAKAVSSIHPIDVLHVVKDHLGKTPGKVFLEERRYNDQCTATIIYYKSPFRKWKWLSSFISGMQYFIHFTGATRKHINVHGKPHLVHVHIIPKAGLIALYLKLFYRIPYVISEQWTGYCAGARPHYSESSRLMKWMYRQVIKHASGLTVVSQYLGDSINTTTGAVKFSIIPNVVDTTLFYPAANSHHEHFCFIHVSTLNKNKNTSQILEAVKILRGLSRTPFQLIVYGPLKPELQALVSSYGISDLVVFKGETPQEVLCEDIRNADALILYSRVETFGCVIIEANACGVPVIVSDIPVLHENVVNGITGTFVPLDRADLLAKKMLWMMNHKDEFDTGEIVNITVSKFGFQTVARQFDCFYAEIIGKGTR